MKTLITLLLTTLISAHALAADEVRCHILTNPGWLASDLRSTHATLKTKYTFSRLNDNTINVTISGSPDETLNGTHKVTSFPRVGTISFMGNYRGLLSDGRTLFIAYNESRFDDEEAYMQGNFNIEVKIGKFFNEYDGSASDIGNQALRLCAKGSNPLPTKVITRRNVSFGGDTRGLATQLNQVLQNGTLTFGSVEIKCKFSAAHTSYGTNWPDMDTCDILQKRGEAIGRANRSHVIKTVLVGEVAQAFQKAFGKLNATLLEDDFFGQNSDTLRTDIISTDNSVTIKTNYR